MEITEDIKKVIEENGISFATVNEFNKPHIIIVADIKIISKNQILIADNFMKNTVENLKNNNNVSIMVWDKKITQDSLAYEIIGEAQYFSEGKWKEEGHQIDPDCETKGAILVTVTKIKKLSLI